jgi:hypothetical protein
MAESRTNQPVRARASYAEALRYVPADLVALADGRSGKGIAGAAAVQHDWLITEVLRREAERTLFPGLDGFLQGKHRPADNDERLSLAHACRLRGRYREAAGLYADAFAADEKLAADLSARHRFLAACCSARAGRVMGPQGTPEEKSRLRNQALGWMRAELADRVKQAKEAPGDRKKLQEALKEWQATPDLIGVRAPVGLARIPKEERDAWVRFWAEAAARASAGGE